MSIPLSDRAAYVVFDYVEPRVHAGSGDTLRKEGWKASAVVTDRQCAEAWASEDMTSRVIETTYTHAWQIKDAGRLYSADELQNFLTCHSLAAE
ncbi:hypothetical protein NBRC116590_03040 [Pelagimonas sp. KU-00592-HH]|uniref:hypothetical protein n=1 Tax=Pelagimonas sp. KU-00592-HH TaxID=3127651 RepID=UPI003108B239